MVVGVAIPGEDTPRLHYKPRFDANEDVLIPGVTVLATVAQYYLGRASVGSGRYGGSPSLPLLRCSLVQCENSERCKQRSSPLERNYCWV